jgi:hypothetical protein
VALAHEVVERAQGLLDRGDRVVGVDLVEVDVVGLQPAQAGLHRIHDVAARGAAVVGPRAHVAIDLGGDDHVLSAYAQVLQALAQQLLGLAEGVDVGCVDEVDPGPQRAADDVVHRLLAERADRLPHALLGRAAEGHGPEADLGDEEAGAAELVVAHGESSRAAVRRIWRGAGASSRLSFPR